MNDKPEISQETMDAFLVLARMLNVQLPTSKEAVESIVHLFGHAGHEYIDWQRSIGMPKIITPDGVVCDIIDAPAVVYPDGRKLTNYGTVYSE